MLAGLRSHALNSFASSESASKKASSGSSSARAASMAAMAQLSPVAREWNLGFSEAVLDALQDGVDLRARPVERKLEGQIELDVVDVGRRGHPLIVAGHEAALQAGWQCRDEAVILVGFAQEGMDGLARQPVVDEVLGLVIGAGRRHLHATGRSGRGARRSRPR